MMRIRLDINGREIGAIGVWNTGETRDGKVRYQIHNLQDGDYHRIGGAPKLDDVWHDPSDGAAALTATAMTTIEEGALDR